MWEDRIIVFDGYEWPAEALLQSLRNSELGREEFWRRTAHAAVAMRDDEDFIRALDDVKRRRYKTGFPSLEATTPQNEPPKMPSRMMPPGGRDSQAAGRRKKSGAGAVARPKTLAYYRHGNNGVLRAQRRRVDIVFRLWNTWGWIDDKTEPGDFDRFWVGSPRHCNIDWTANSTILTILLQELQGQPYINKQTGLSAKSMVEQQFGKTPNSDRTRYTQADWERIRCTLLVLDIRNPLPLRQDGDDDDYDVQEAALREVLAGQLRTTKGI